MCYILNKQTKYACHSKVHSPTCEFSLTMNTLKEQILTVYFQIEGPHQHSFPGV